MAAIAIMLIVLSLPPVAETARAAVWPAWGKDLTMRHLLGLAGVLLAASAGAGQRLLRCAHNDEVKRKES
jgi:hypothetical protein